jgi:membrane-associated protease RseP (regulator of RpoE activity)
MNNPRHASSLEYLSWIAFVLTTLAVAGLVTVAPAAGGTAPGQDAIVSLGKPSAEIVLSAPAWYAIVLKAPGKVRMLYARGDIVVYPKDPMRSLTVEQVEAEAISLRTSPRGRLRTLPAGKPIPGFPDLLFTGTVLLDQLNYRYRVVERILNQDPTLVSLEGSRAILDVEVLQPTAPPPAPEPLPVRAMLDGDLLSRVRVREVGPGVYEVPAADARAVLDNAGRVLADIAPLVLPIFSLQTGLQYRITSAASDGILTGQGYTVTIPKLAERAGLEVGDTILSVNGQTVNGFPSLFRIFRAVRRDPDLHMVEMELERQGARLVKTYKIR